MVNFEKKTVLKKLILNTFGNNSEHVFEMFPDMLLIT
jgi:hypothetical protein